MSNEEIKYEINKVLEHFSKDALEELLVFLKQVEEKKAASVSNAERLHKILSEDKELLAKLAQ